MACSLIAAACACNKNNDDNKNEDSEGQEEVSKEFTATRFNGYMVEELAKAYESFVEKDLLPASVNVEGILYGKGQYIAAACLLLKQIQEDPENWEKEEVDVPVRMTWGGNLQNNTFEQDSISLEALSWAAEKAYAYGVKNGSMPNYVSF